MPVGPTNMRVSTFQRFDGDWLIYLAWLYNPSVMLGKWSIKRCGWFVVGIV
jgi:hypothetical protein